MHLLSTSHYLSRKRDIKYMYASTLCTHKLNFLFCIHVYTCTCKEGMKVASTWWKVWWELYMCVHVHICTFNCTKLTCTWTCVCSMPRKLPSCKCVCDFCRPIWMQIHVHARRHPQTLSLFMRDKTYYSPSMAKYLAEAICTTQCFWHDHI